MTEVVVALAIASLIAVGMGSILSFGATLQSRSEANREVQSRVMDLIALTTLIEDAPRLRLGNIDANGFDLARHDPGPHPPLSLRVAIHDDAAIVQSRTDSGTATGAASVDLAPFDTASILYLAAEPLAWVPASETPNRNIRAAKLVVREGHRAWPFILWSDAPAMTEPLP